MSADNKSEHITFAHATAQLRKHEQEITLAERNRLREKAGEIPVGVAKDNQEVEEVEEEEDVEKTDENKTNRCSN